MQGGSAEPTSKPAPAKAPIDKSERTINLIKAAKKPKYKLIEPKAKKLTLSSALRSKIDSHDKQQFNSVISQVQLLDMKGCDELLQQLQR